MCDTKLGFFKQFLSKISNKHVNFDFGGVILLILTKICDSLRTLHAFTFTRTNNDVSNVERQTRQNKVVTYK